MLSDIFIVKTTQHPPRSTVQSKSKVETMGAGLSSRPDNAIIIFQDYLCSTISAFQTISQLHSFTRRTRDEVKNSVKITESPKFKQLEIARKDSVNPNSNSSSRSVRPNSMGKDCFDETNTLLSS